MKLGLWDDEKWFEVFEPKLWWMKPDETVVSRYGGSFLGRYSDNPNKTKHHPADPRQILWSLGVSFWA